jgi:hypothetical protein
VLSHHVQGPRPAETPPADTFGKGHRADGAPPRGPGAEASAPWPRSLPDRGSSDPGCAQPVAPAMAVALLSRHARDTAPLASGALETQVETLANPARAWTSTTS